ncbi:MAG: dihydrolipoamide dehydrogenase [Myxococcota bacterium]
MATKKAGAVVIGAGPGGYVCAIRLGQLGVDTICVEEQFFGGVCLNVGCIPSKALITASKHYAHAADVKTMGINMGDVSVDMTQMQAWKSSITKKLTSGVETLLKGNGVATMGGRARITGKRTVEVTAPNGEITTIEAEAIVLATGSRPIEIPGFAFDQENVLDSTGGLALAELPERLVVIGGGYIGLELGGTFGRLGSKLTIVEMMDQLLPGFDKDLVRPVERRLKSHDTNILLEHRAIGWRKDGDDLVVEVQDKANTKKELRCDKILVTVGRRPNTENLGLDSVGVKLDKRGFIQANKQRETTARGIYAIGDIVDGPMLAHKASAEGEVVAEVIAGHEVAFEPRCIPAIVFTDPEVAEVGLSAKAAKAKGLTVKTGRFPFSALGRAMTTGETDGFIRVVIDADSTEILGVQIVGPEASDLIAEAGLAIEMGAIAEDVALTIHAHPSLAEGIMEAAKAAIGQAIHAINR